MIQKKDENGEKYATASDEAEFHEALNRGLAVELTWELAEKIGLMVEDVGTVAEIDQGVGCGKGRNDTLRTIQRFCHLYSPVSRMWAQPRGEMCGRNSGTTGRPACLRLATASPSRPGAGRPPRLGTEAHYGEEILLAARGRLREEGL